MRFVFVLLVLTSVVSCAPATSTSGDAAPNLDGTSWRVEKIRGTAVVAGSNLTLVFADGAASGNAGCNQYRSEASLAGTSLMFGPSMSTKRACLDDAMNRQEGDFLGALTAVKSYDMSGGRLLLRDDSGGVVIELARQ